MVAQPLFQLLDPGVILFSEQQVHVALPSEH